MLTYQQFVDELKPLIDQARSLSGATDENPEFRRWRHEVTDLIKRIESAGFPVNCSIQVRTFGAQFAYAERSAAGFRRDLEDTITELATLTTRFEKFGEPARAMNRAASTDEANEQPEIPKRQTLKERFEGHPVPFISSLVVASALAGWGVRNALDPAMDSRSSRQAAPVSLNCRVDGLDALAQHHHTRLQTMQNQLAELEKTASASFVTTSDREVAMDAARRVRADIDKENASHFAELAALKKVCLSTGVQL